MDIRRSVGAQPFIPLTTHPCLVYPKTMKFFLKVSLVVLFALALIVPLTAITHCEDEHESECATECACVCSCEPVFITLEQAYDLSAHASEYAGSLDILFPGRLLIADIFRPPTSA